MTKDTGAPIFWLGALVLVASACFLLAGLHDLGVFLTCCGAVLMAAIIEVDG